MSLLKTKLFIPSVQPNYIPRPQLEARLKESRNAKLILLSAPAGYGKTTLIADWLNTNKLTPAWISLDHQDNDPARFFGYLAEALRSVEPGISEEFSYLIKGTHLPPPEALMESLINALVSHTPQADNLSPENRLLVILDDYHKIQNDSIHQAVQYLLDYQPPNLLLVLLTREDPPLALARMRAKGELIELRIKDLRFSEGEISRVFQSLTDLELDPESIKSLASITEGWAACLQLAALSAKGHQDIPHYLKGFSGTNRYVIDYLMDEVMQGLTEEIRTFLLQTSILERFTADLCDAVRNRQDSQQILTTLLQSNLFLIPLDDKWEWFRYHHLFGDFILAELNKTEPDLEQQLHQRACQWYRSQGYLEEAINHALLGKDFLSAAELILESGSKMIASGELGTLLSWMKELPQKLVIDNLDLRCLYLWTLYFTGDTEKTEKLLSEFGETDLKEINPQARGWLLSLQAWIANNHDQPSAVPLAEKALEVIQANDLFNRAITHILIGHNHFRRGKMAQAIQAYRAAASLGWESRAYLALVTAVDSLALTMNECGQRQEALTVLQDSADNLVDHKGRTLPIADMLSISRSVLAYENNQLPLAIALAHKGQWAGRRFLSQQVMGAEAENILVQAYAAQEDYSSANAVIEEARRLGSGLGWISSILDALQAHLFYVQGHLKGVEEWARQANISPDTGITPHCELCYLTYGRLLLVQERYQEAGQFLNQISVKAKHSGRNAILISLLILEARCLQGQGEKPGAQKKMASALKLAAPEGYLRRFLNESGYILDILRDCQGDQDFQADLSLNSFINELLQTISGNSLEIISQSPSASKSRLIEPLTNQELTVLRLLSSGLSNQEISDELVIGMSTTKWHLHNIYGKLGVKNRTSAIVKAQNLALI